MDANELQAKVEAGNLSEDELHTALRDHLFYIREERNARAEKSTFKRALEIVFDMGGNPKADKLFDLAWEYGHSCGFSEVLINYEDLLPLVK